MKVVSLLILHKQLFYLFVEHDRALRDIVFPVKGFLAILGLGAGSASGAHGAEGRGDRPGAARRADRRPGHRAGAGRPRRRPAPPTGGVRPGSVAESQRCPHLGRPLGGAGQALGHGYQF